MTWGRLGGDCGGTKTSVTNVECGSHIVGSLHFEGRAVTLIFMLTLSRSECCQLMRNLSSASRYVHICWPGNSAPRYAHEDRAHMLTRRHGLGGLSQRCSNSSKLQPPPTGECVNKPCVFPQWNTTGQQGCTHHSHLQRLGRVSQPLRWVNGARHKWADTVRLKSRQD